MTTTTDTRNTLRFLDGYASILTTGATRGASVVELVMPEGSASPEHIHDEDETIVVLEGDVVFRVGGETVRPDERGRIVLPQGVAHSYRVGSDDARWLSIGAGRYEAFVRAVGRPLDSAPAGELDLAGAVALTVAAAQNGIEIVGPPPLAEETGRVSSLMERLHGSLSLPSRLSPVAA